MKNIGGINKYYMIKFEVKKVVLHNKELQIYIPLKIPKQLTAIDPVIWEFAILGNTIAFEFLQKIFCFASQISSNEIIYIPTKTLKYNEYKNIWRYGIFDMDIVLINYHALQIKSKEIDKAISISKKIKGKETDKILDTKNIQVPRHWLGDRKLCTKRKEKVLIISTNRDVYSQFAYEMKYLTGFKDSEDCNFDYHIHEDRIGTSKSNGFNFLYYHREENIN